MAAADDGCGAELAAVPQPSYGCSGAAAQPRAARRRRLHLAAALAAVCLLLSPSALPTSVHRSKERDEERASNALEFRNILLNVSALCDSVGVPREPFLISFSRVVAISWAHVALSDTPIGDPSPRAFNVPHACFLLFQCAATWLAAVKAARNAHGWDEPGMVPLSVRELTVRFVWELQASAAALSLLAVAVSLFIVDRQHAMLDGVGHLYNGLEDHWRSPSAAGSGIRAKVVPRACVELVVCCTVLLLIPGLALCVAGTLFAMPLLLLFPCMWSTQTYWVWLERRCEECTFLTFLFSIPIAAIYAIYTRLPSILQSVAVSTDRLAWLYWLPSARHLGPLMLYADFALYVLGIFVLVVVPHLVLCDRDELVADDRWKWLFLERLARAYLIAVLLQRTASYTVLFRGGSAYWFVADDEGSSIDWSVWWECTSKNYEALAGSF